MTTDSLLQLAHGGLAPARVAKLLGDYGSVDRAVAAIVTGKARVKPTVRAAVEVPAEQRTVELRTAGVAFVSRDDERYPPHLRRFESAPLWLFVRESRIREQWPPRMPAIGIVGSRSCTTYGLELAEAYGSTSARLGWAVVSGLARGIDAAAHRGALAAHGACVGVLGCGLDVVYPAENGGLYRSVVESGGSLMSEYPPGSRPAPWKFPTRNRIIAGLSDVLLVVEASEKGGALITARIALEYGVPIYAVPGDVDRDTSRGTNALIRDGAFPIFGSDDLAQVLDLVTPFIGVDANRP